MRQASTAADLRKLHSELPPDVDALLAKMAKEAGIDPATLPERMANFDRANAGAHPPPTPRPPFKCIARAQIVYALLLL